KVNNDRLQLNEDSVWYGGVMQGDNPDAQKYLPKIRQLLMDGRQQEAEDLAQMTMMSFPKSLRPYQPLADFNMWYTGGKPRTTNYYRELDIEQANARISYRANNELHNREVFSSAVDQVVVLRLTSEQDDLNIRFNYARRPFDFPTERIADDTIRLSGNQGEDGVDFSTTAKVTSEGGTIEAIGDFISVTNAKTITVYIAAGTTIRYEDPQ